jgi:threonine synthase
MSFCETRGNDGIKKSEVEFSYAILNPSASYGGLYVPTVIPTINEDEIEALSKLNYKELAFDIVKRFGIDVSDDDLKSALDLYDDFDDKNSPVPIVKVDDELFVSELWHGPTRAFKDMALQPFGKILSSFAKKIDEKYLILAATSGDTGPATLDTFADKENIKVVCLYPDGGTSDVQRLQMTTQDADNLKIIGIHGNFDDAQNALKMLLASNEFKNELQKLDIKLSAANSVNFGRIIFQIIYHINSYLGLLRDGVIKTGEKIYITVPSGNFGNALGAYYAKKMGMPIEKILIASNINNILTELIQDGVYDLRGKKLLKTTSPAMDILISSNVERLLYDKFGASRCKEMMDDLKATKCYSLSKKEKEAIKEDFDAVYCDDDFAKETIARYAKIGYVMDPHTATCLKAHESLRDKPLKNVICSTAEWTKFAPTMLNAIKNDEIKYNDEVALGEVSLTLKVDIPHSIKELFDKSISHKSVVDKDHILREIFEFLER